MCGQESTHKTTADNQPFGDLKMVWWARKRRISHGLTDGLTEKANQKKQVIPILFPILFSRSTVWRPHVALPSSPSANRNYPRDNHYYLIFYSRFPKGNLLFLLLFRTVANHLSIVCYKMMDKWFTYTKEPSQWDGSFNFYPWRFAITCLNAYAAKGISTNRYV